MNRILEASAIFLLIAGAGCLPGPKDEPGPNSKNGPTPAGSQSTPAQFSELPFSPVDTPDQSLRRDDGTQPTSSLDPSNTYGHESVHMDPFDLLARLQEEGPPEVASRMHGCQKLRYETLGNILEGLGVNVDPSAMGPSSGGLWRDGAQVLGAANFAARVPESLAITTAGATKLFDIFVQAAPEIVAQMPSTARCKVRGRPTMMFDDQGTCTLDGISCLQGFLATAQQKALCDRVIGQASSPNVGKTIAVASVLAAAHTCE